MKILNEEQMDTFLAAVDGNEIWRDFFYTELMTGLRLGRSAASCGATSMGKRDPEGLRPHAA